MERKRRNPLPALKAKVALAGFKGNRVLVESSE